MSGDATVSALLLDNARLRSKLAEVQAALAAQHAQLAASSGATAHGADDTAAQRETSSGVSAAHRPTVAVSPAPVQSPSAVECALSRSSILRFSRHLLLSELGNQPVQFVDAVQRSAVLVVGAGGLGCPALLYLAAAGVGRLSVVDGDVVELSNLPRQVLFDERHVGRSKAEVAAGRVRGVSPSCRVEWHYERFSPSNAESFTRGFDVLLDCSDNVATRYLCNDVAVLLGLPCVSASALRLEGQLSVYGARSDGGPCYRCLYPLPVASHLVTNCNEGGILNAVTGVMGTLQALEALKCIAQRRQARDGQPASSLEQSTARSPYRCPALSSLSGRLLLFDGCDSSFRSVKLRGRSPQCAVCGDDEWRRITLNTLRQQQYSSLCSADRTASFDDHAVLAEAALSEQPSLSHVAGVSASLLASQLRQRSSASALPFVLLDVRPSLQFDIAHLPHSINVPRDELTQRWPEVQRAVAHAVAVRTPHSDALGSGSGLASTPLHCRLFVLCRRGVDSLHASRWLVERWQQEQRQQQHGQRVDVLNVQGGLMAWTELVDAQFPLY